MMTIDEPASIASSLSRLSGAPSCSANRLGRFDSPALKRIELTIYRLLLRSNKEVVRKPSFENADNSGFSAYFDCSGKVYSQSHYSNLGILKDGFG